ncbi:MAG: ribonuclease H-like YkuK family protein [Candidatus Nealsonbacteria bacterium]|nr:ribonuclease H-like YkuK family protein [Candidatus Nealsonbacteria bacterium]
MEDIISGHFYNPTKGNLTFDEVIKEIFGYIAQDKEKFYDIVVGCDSSSGEEPTFPVVIVALRKGGGGRFFLKRIKYSSDRKFYNWKERILNEVYLSCQMALILKEKIAGLKTNFLNYEFRYIHADVGENGATKDMVKEVTGLIRGNGFEPKIKPESYVASVVADRYA